LDGNVFVICSRIVIIIWAGVNPFCRTPPDRRKVGRREAGSEAARRRGRWPRKSRKVRSRVGIEFRKGLAAGAGGSFREQ